MFCLLYTSAKIRVYLMTDIKTFIKEGKRFSPKNFSTLTGILPSMNLTLHELSSGQLAPGELPPSQKISALSDL